MISIEISTPSGERPNHLSIKSTVEAF